MKAHAKLTFSLLLVALLATACHRLSREDKISAHDDASFDQWISDHKTVLTATDVPELNDARQQIRYHVMQQHPGMMSDDFAAAVYGEIDGKTAHDLIVNGYEIQSARLKAEIANYEPDLKQFKSHDPSQLGSEQKKYVTESIAKLERLVREHQQELDRVTKRLDELKQTAGGPGSHN